MNERPTIAAFRPADDRAEDARTVIEAVGGRPLLDPMLSVEPTGASPRTDAAITIFTSATVATLPAVQSWESNATTVVAVGPKTAAALEDLGLAVDRVPTEFTSTGIVEELGDEVDGLKIEVARSNHGSDVLLDGLMTNGAYLHETILYRLVRPDDAGHSIEALLAGEVAALAFSSSLTVEHFLACVAEHANRDALEEALEEVLVGVIGPPTAATAKSAGIPVNIVASSATFETLVDELMTELETPTRRA